MTDSPKPTMLIVEDEALILQLAVMTLEDKGMRILEASDVEQAMSLVDRLDNLEVLVTDIQMPGKLDGLHLASTVRQRFPKCAIVLMSGRSLPTDRPVPEMARYISKPWVPSALEAAVTETIGTGQAVPPR